MKHYMTHEMYYMKRYMKHEMQETCLLYEARDARDVLACYMKREMHVD
jgi:hypothetical protein